MSGEKVEHPIRLRVNTETLINMFHRGDQSILDAFTDIVTSMRGRRVFAVNEPKSHMFDPDERCPEINFYQYRIEPIKPKTEE